jgi:phosphoribosylformylglycinamidine cyclo-ligase
MLRTFNCGIGMVVVAAEADAERVAAALREAGESPVTLGRVVEAAEEPRVRTTGALSLDAR